MIGVALKGLLGRKLRATLTAFAIVLGVAMISGSLHPHRHARQELRRHLQRLVQGDRRRHQLEGGDQDRRRRLRSSGLLGRRADARSRACPACVSRRARSRTRRGSSTRAARRSARPATGVAIGVDPSADQSLNPLQLVSGQWPSGDGQIAIDKSTAEKQRLRSRPDRRRVRRRAAGEVPRSAGSSASDRTTRSAAPRSRVYDLATAQKLFDKRGKFDLIRVGAEERRVGRRAASGRSTRCSPRRRR